MELDKIELQNQIKSKVKIDKSGCWNWQGYKTKKGYGTLPILRKPVKAHRISYLVFRGEIPNDLFVCHKCDNPSCVNPDHLFIGSNSDNMKDAQEKGRLKNMNNFNFDTRSKGGKIGGAIIAKRKRKLNDSQLEEVRELLENNGDKYGIVTSIAKKYGVRVGIISAIKHGRKYKAGAIS